MPQALLQQKTYVNIFYAYCQCLINKQGEMKQLWTKSVLLSVTGISCCSLQQSKQQGNKILINLFPSYCFLCHSKITF